MDLDSTVILVFYAAIALYCSTSDARSFQIKDPKVSQAQAYLWEDSCPPMAFQEVEVERSCTDTCHTDDYCTGRRLCCLFNGCKSCLEPVLPPAVIDWLGGSDRAEHFKRYRNEGEADNTIVITDPHYEEVECLLDGKTYMKGIFYQGCRKCLCNIGGYITCELRCKDDKKILVDQEASGSGDEDDASSGNAPVKEEHQNELFPVSYRKNIQKDGIRPEPLHMALDQPRPEIIRLVENSGDSESGEGEENGSGDDNEMLEQKYSSYQHKMTTQQGDVNQVPKIGDIFLVK